MTHTRLIGPIVVALLLGLPAAGRAQSRQDLQTAADLRILAENVSKLQLAVNQLGEQIKTVNRRLDDENAAAVKRYADTRQQIIDLTSTVNTIREKLDDNTVRVSQLTQEVSTIRDALRMSTQLLNQLISLLQPPSGGGTGDPGAPGAGATSPAATFPNTAFNPPESPKKCFDDAWTDSMAGRLPLAISGYETCLTKYPNSPDAPRALVRLGNAYYQQAKYPQAIATYSRVINNYKDAEEVAEALMQQGLAYQAVGDRDNARKVYQQLTTKYATSIFAAQAEQKLKQLNIR